MKRNKNQLIVLLVNSIATVLFLLYYYLLFKNVINNTHDKALFSALSLETTSSFINIGSIYVIVALIVNGILAKKVLKFKKWLLYTFIMVVGNLIILISFFMLYYGKLQDIYHSLG